MLTAFDDFGLVDDIELDSSLSLTMYDYLQLPDFTSVRPSTHP
jgi:hypothetical protein